MPSEWVEAGGDCEMGLIALCLFLVIVLLLYHSLEIRVCDDNSGNINSL